MGESEFAGNFAEKLKFAAAKTQTTDLMGSRVFILIIIK